MPKPKTTEKELTKDEAAAMLPEGDEIHTFRDNVVDTPSGRAGLLMGADHSRESILSKIMRFPCFLAGPGATSMGHGLCIRDIDDMPLFVQTRADADEDEGAEDDGTED